MRRYVYVSLKHAEGIFYSERTVHNHSFHRDIFCLRALCSFPLSFSPPSTPTGTPRPSRRAWEWTTPVGVVLPPLFLLLPPGSLVPRPPGPGGGRGGATRFPLPEVGVRRQRTGGRRAFQQSVARGWTSAFNRPPPGLVAWTTCTRVKAAPPSDPQSDTEVYRPPRMCAVDTTRRGPGSPVVSVRPVGVLVVTKQVLGSRLSLSNPGFRARKWKRIANTSFSGKILGPPSTPRVKACCLSLLRTQFCTFRESPDETRSLQSSIIKYLHTLN